MSFSFARTKKLAERTSEEIPFRILVAGDFGGHTSRSEVRSGPHVRPYRVDVDSLPALFRKLDPKVELRLGDEPRFTIPITEIEDFHPDHLFSTLEFFAPMRQLRRQLQDPKTFAQAAAMLGAPTALSTPPAPSPADEDLQRLLGRPASAVPQRVSPTSPMSVVQGLIREAVAPHVVGAADPRKNDLVASADGMTNELMRAVLHDPGFQALEATWRSLDRLVRNLELDENLQLFVLDVSREELLEDLSSAPTLTESWIYGVLSDTQANTPWSLLTSLHPWNLGKVDAALLSRLGAMAQEVDAAVLAGVSFAAWSNGFASLEDKEAWDAMRQAPFAEAIAVALPGVLLRLPFGKDCEVVEQFSFTEQASPPVMARYLWGSAAAAITELLGQAFRAAGGWEFAPGEVSVLGDVPTHIAKIDGESTQMPCTQAWLPESKIDALLKEGWTPLVPVRGRGEARIPRIQSIAIPPAPLAGRWRAS